MTIMKKTGLAVLALAASFGIANAQHAYEGNKIGDNWYAGVQVGGVIPVSEGGMHGAFGIEIGKQLTPVVGVSFQGLTAANTTWSASALDYLSLGLNGKLNLNNLFAGYNGKPRLFEIETVVGLNWGHEFFPSSQRWDDSYLTSRFGASLNFNLGESKAWSINVKPAIVYKMDGYRAQCLNKNNAYVELLAGVTYHFKCSNGKHYRTIQKAYDQAEVDALNQSINDLRKELSDKNSNIDALKAENARTKADLQNCLNDKNKNKEVTSFEPVVSFPIGKYLVESRQMANIEKIADFMKNNPSATINVCGYASPEGNAEYNQKLSVKRAETVKEILVNKFGIEADRINAEGKGVGSMFSKPNMNRVTITTLTGM